MTDLTNPIFTDANKAREYLEAINWPEGPFCPHCGETRNVHRLQGKSTRPGLIQCNSCLKNFTVTVGTVFERSKLPLNKWLLATYLLSSSKKGMSAHQLHRMLGITYKSAWFMFHRIREAMRPGSPDPMGGYGRAIEADETYVGGKDKNRHASKRTEARGPKLHEKMAVVSLVERGGDVRSFHVANVTGPLLRNILVTNADRGSWLMTDEHSGYKAVGKEFTGHGVIAHSRGEYGRYGVFHTNTIENFFSIFKRGVIGTYHHISENHLHRYTTEFDFRYNTRKDTDTERAEIALKGIVGKRLTYRRPDQIAA